MMVSACIVFDVAIYPLMIWFLFIDVPDFLRSLGHFREGKPTKARTFQGNSDVSELGTKRWRGVATF